MLLGPAAQTGCAERLFSAGTQPAVSVETVHASLYQDKDHLCANGGMSTPFNSVFCSTACLHGPVLRGSRSGWDHKRGGLGEGHVRRLRGDLLLLSPADLGRDSLLLVLTHFQGNCKSEFLCGISLFFFF